MTDAILYHTGGGKLTELLAAWRATTEQAVIIGDGIGEIYAVDIGPTEIKFPNYVRLEPDEVATVAEVMERGGVTGDMLVELARRQMGDSAKP